MEEDLVARRRAILEEHFISLVQSDDHEGPMPANLTSHQAVLRTCPRALSSLLLVRPTNDAYADMVTFKADVKGSKTKLWDGYLVDIAGHEYGPESRAFVAMPYNRLGRSGDADWPSYNKENIYVFAENGMPIDTLRSVLPRLSETVDWWPRKFTLGEINDMIEAAIQRRFPDSGDD